VVEAPTDGLGCTAPGRKEFQGQFPFRSRKGNHISVSSVDSVHVRILEGVKIAIEDQRTWFGKTAAKLLVNERDAMPGTRFNSLVDLTQRFKDNPSIFI
jgi:hypothetical protein